MALMEVVQKMYCSTCGGAVAAGLSYCNHCGARLSAAKGDDVTRVAKVPSESLVWAIVGVFVVGLGCMIGLMAVMKEEFNANIGLVIFFALLVFLLMLVVEGVFISLLVGRRGDVKRVKNPEQMKEQTTNELNVAPARVLSEPVPSVTEHTTRAFEPVYVQQKAE
jgi:hypothetical protein